jgi:hypothetical protein
MNKFKLISLSVLGGIDVTLSIFTPIILASLYVTLFGLVDWKGYFFYGIGLSATIFRAIKIGWLKND